jgi:hypothetical protein
MKPCGHKYLNLITGQIFVVEYLEKIYLQTRMLRSTNFMEVLISKAAIFYLLLDPKTHGR